MRKGENKKGYFTNKKTRKVRVRNVEKYRERDLF